nr:TIGR04168 family protein [Gloeothece verrucosa]
MIKIAVIGDIHDQWEKEDNQALQHLDVDLALFVGDFGNESLAVVGLIAALELPKAAILGNHDAWYTASAWGRAKSPYDHELENRVQEQLDLLGEAHVGYGKLDLPQFNLSVVGSRPFSWGGQDWKNKEFLNELYGITNFQQSTAKIVAQAQDAAYDTLIFVGHNGPLGLGEEPHSICGQDWPPLGGDHGDPDFSEALTLSRQLGKTISLVTFGHMHHRLRHTQAYLRTMVETDPYGTVYLNAASVPRIKEENGEKLRNFSFVSLEEGKVTQIELVWVGEDFRIVSRQPLYQDAAKIPQAV